MKSTLRFTTKSAAETKQLGHKLGALLSGNELIELTGDLGTGKTVFIKGLAEGLGIKQPIASPTFTISRVYEFGTKRFYHFDFYRIDLKDIVAFEIAEAAQDLGAIVAVEWAEHVKDALPANHLNISFTTSGQKERTIEFIPTGEHYAKLVEALR